jgi:hypothetical protein
MKIPKDMPVMLNEKQIGKCILTFKGSDNNRIKYEISLDIDDEKAKKEIDNLMQQKPLSVGFSLSIGDSKKEYIFKDKK